MISVLILTFNEEINLGECLRSISFSNDIVVLDSYSTDATESISKEHGVTFLRRSFDNYAAQRNFGLTHPFKNEWILMLDADERVDEELRAEIERSIKDCKSTTALFRMRRKDFFMGRWIRRSSGYPTWFGRLFRKGTLRVEREINEEYHSDGSVEFLREHLLHFPFNKGVTYWIERHNIYSAMEARRLLHERTSLVEWRLFFSTDPSIRRKAFKQVAYRAPLRPLLTFCFLYLLKGGFLDGVPGFHFSLMRSFYEYLIDLKISEANRSE